MPNTSYFLRSVAAACLLLIAASIAATGSYVATNPLKGCSVDVNNQMTCPGGFSTGAGSGNSILLSGATSGVATITPPAVAGTPTLTLPTVSGTFMLTNTAVSNSQLPLLGPGVIPGSKFTSIAVANGGSGDVDLYTVPASSRAFVTSMTCYNTAGTTTTIIPEINVSGTYYRVNSSASAVTLTTGSVAYSIYFEAGEIIAANFSQAGLNCHGSVVLYPDTVPFKTVKLLSVSTGDNTVYTVPAGLNAVSVAGSTPSYSGSGSYVGSAGGTVKWYVVPSGQSVGSTYQVTAATVVGGNTLSNLSAFKAAPSGSFVVMNMLLASGTNVAWVNVYETPN